MAATEHDFSDTPLPRILALDADFVVSVIVESEPFHETCAKFSARLVRESVTIVHSPLLRLEVLRAWQKAINSKALPQSILPQRLLWDDPASERRLSYQLANDYLDEFLGLFRRLEVRLTSRIQRRTWQLMATHGLKPMDACRLACAMHTGSPHIASLDRDFRRVDGLHLWNDLIPSKRQARRRSRH